MVLVAGRGAARSRATSPAAASSRTPRRCSTRCVDGGPARGGRGRGRGRRRSRWPTRARPSWRGTAPPAGRSPPAIVWQDRRAESVCAGLVVTSAERVAALTGLVLDPYFSAPKMRLAARPRDHRGRGDHDRHLAGAPAVRRVRHRRLDGQPLAAARPRRRAPGPASCSTCSGSVGEALPDIVACDDVVGETGLFGGRVPVTGLIVDQQAALLGRGLPGGRHGEVHVRHRRVPARPARRARRVRSSAGLTTSVAWRLGDHTSYCVDGQVYTAASAVRWADRARLVVVRTTSSTRSPRPRATGVLCVPALAGLAAPWWDAQRHARRSPG